MHEINQISMYVNRIAAKKHREARAGWVELEASISMKGEASFRDYDNTKVTFTETNLPRCIRDIAPNQLNHHFKGIHYTLLAWLCAPTVGCFTAARARFTTFMSLLTFVSGSGIYRPKNEMY